MKHLLSLFDHTGTWSQPFYDSTAWTVTEVDLKNWIPIDINSVASAEAALDLFGDVDGILAAPPCTDFSVSGAQYWCAKDRDGRTARSVALVRQVLRLVDLYRPTDPDYLAEGGTFFWALENPVGRLPRLVRSLGRPVVIFDPCEYGLYMQRGEKTHPLAPPRDAYTKRTCLWGEFNVPPKRPVTPVRSCRQGSWLQKLGGKSETTKTARATTPLGFARAFFEANQ